MKCLSRVVLCCLVMSGMILCDVSCAVEKSKIDERDSSVEENTVSGWDLKPEKNQGDALGSSVEGNSSGNESKQHRNEDRTSLEEGDFFEGDIILTSKQQARGLPTEPTLLWPNGVLFYDFSEEFNEEQRHVVEAAILDLQQETCVRFVRTRPWDRMMRTHVRFRNAMRGCAALVGYQPQLRTIDLHLSFPGCALRGTIQHELLHALGFWHEHTRADRDDYIAIMWQNIEAGRELNFKTRVHLTDDASHMTSRLMYDYTSVMHYRALAFSRDKLSLTIVPRDPTAFFAMGQRERFSKMDVAKLNALYGC